MHRYRRNISVEEEEYRCVSLSAPMGGDEVSISADYISVEQAIVTLEIENALYNSKIEIETVTLTIDKARELAKALLSVVEAIEFVRTPANLIQFSRKLRPQTNIN